MRPTARIGGVLKVERVTSNRVASPPGPGLVSGTRGEGPYTAKANYRRTIMKSMKSPANRATQVALLLAIASHANAEDAGDYARRVKPVLLARCYACHGVLKQEGGLRLDTAALAIEGGEGGAAVVAGDAGASPLIERVTASEESERMPPEGEPLKTAEVDAIRAWIAGGAKAPQGESPEADPRDHWAFRAPNRPAAPAIEDGAWSRNPIDAFISAEHRRRGLTPRPAADKRTWLRRVTVDLVGLPPDPRRDR